MNDRPNVIQLYRRRLCNKLAQNWHPELQNNSPTILITVDREGHLLKAAIYESSGDNKVDKAALYAATTTTFAPFPSFYEGGTVTFKVNLQRINDEYQ